MFLNFGIYSYVHILAESFIIPAHHPPYFLLKDSIKENQTSTSVCLIQLSNEYYLVTEKVEFSNSPHVAHAERGKICYLKKITYGDLRELQRKDCMKFRRNVSFLSPNIKYA